jgi:hypothetical protein
MPDPRSIAKPPLWLAAAAVAAGWGAAYSIARFVLAFIDDSVHLDTVITYVAAEAGLRYGWARIYDVATLRTLANPFRIPVDPQSMYINTPVWAWMLTPLTAVSEPAAYALWSVLSLLALAWAWYISAPFTGVAKVAMLLTAMALWPVLTSFYFGQPIMVLLALLAAGWWLCAHDRPLIAGAAFALATTLKPHMVILVPLALLVSGRYRPFIGWVAGCAVLGIAVLAALGPTGVVNWWEALKYVEGHASNAHYTLGGQLGFGPLTYALLAVQAATALVIARRRRAELEIVISAGILGCVSAAFYIHQADYSVLILAAWLVLRSSPPMWQRLWLVVGFLTMQVVTTGVVVPQLIWDAGWLAILLVSSYGGSGALAPATPRAAASAGRVGT